ncbi:MAG: VWA domain-containing protein [Spirochaetales bacterium]|nr:VWA domain-containing protein [Spirochaetales bacterium]
MKKSIILISLLVLILSVPLFGSDRIDMIVLLDNSVSVLPYYDEIQNSLLGRIVSEHLAPGDSFSLITFADTPEVEVSREIRGRDDIEKILAYSLLLQPMGTHTDLIMALRFLYRYTLDLPLNNRKKIVILTDGIHDPPEGSPYFHRSSDETRKEIQKAAEDIRRQGWDVSIVEMNNHPLPEFQADFDEDAVLQDSHEDAVLQDSHEDAAVQDSHEDAVQDENRLNVMDEVAASIGTKPAPFDSNEEDMAGVALGTPLVSFPSHLGTFSGNLSVPLNIQNRSNKAVFFSISKAKVAAGDLLKKKVSVEIGPGDTEKISIELVLPDGLLEGEQHLTVKLVLVDGERISPDTLDLKFYYQPKKGLIGNVDKIMDWKILAALIALMVAVIIIIILKKASSSGIFSMKAAEDETIPARLDGKAIIHTRLDEEQVEIRHHEEDLAVMSLTNPDSSDEVHIVKKNRPIHMFVFGQNTKSGVSNVKWLGIHRKRTIGGSSQCFFRIFLVKVPPVIAEIECSGDEFIFHPKALGFFPELKGSLNPCLNKRIKVVTPDDKIFFIEFRQWVSKLEQLNRLLTMTKQPGKPDMDF